MKVRTKGSRHIESAEGHGPVGALDDALRKALTNDYPELRHIELEDYRVRVLAETHGTGAVVRVLIDSSNGERSWTTVGREREHHRGVVGGADGRVPVRPAPPTRRGRVVACGRGDAFDRLDPRAAGRDRVQQLRSADRRGPRPARSSTRPSRWAPPSSTPPTSTATGDPRSSSARRSSSRRDGP